MRSPAQLRHHLTQRIVAVAASLCAVGLLYVLVARDDTSVETDASPPQRGYYLTDSTTTEMDAAGRPQMTLHARTTEENLPDQSVDMSDITFDYATNKYGDWHGTALKGHMTPDRKSILLTGDVVMSSEQELGLAVIRTQHLHYAMDTSLVTTADPVDVKLGRNTLNARGLRADLNAQTLKLESNVNGRFTP